MTERNNNNNSKIVFVVNGGIGKNIASIGAIDFVIDYLDKKEKTRREFCVLASHPYIFTGLGWEVYGLNEPHIFDRIDFKQSEILSGELYLLRSWRNGKCNMVQAWSELYLKGLGEYYIYTDGSSIQLPKYSKYKILKDEKIWAEKYLIDLFIQLNIPQNKWQEVPVILFQPFGGWFMSSPTFSLTGRELDIKVANQIALELQKSGAVVIQVKAQNEPALQGIIQLPNISVRKIIALLSLATTFIGVDSFLQHSGASIGKKGIVLWGSTSPNSNGYDLHINLNRGAELNLCSFPNCLRPVWGLPDILPVDSINENPSWRCPYDWVCMEYKVEEVLEAVRKLIEDKDKEVKEIKESEKEVKQIV